MRRPAFLTIALVLVVAGQPLHAARQSGSRGAAGQRLQTMTEKLGLSDEQQAKVRAIFTRHAPELRALLKKGRKNLGKEERKKVRELQRTQMREIDSILTAEQRAKLQELRKQRADGARRKSAGKI